MNAPVATPPNGVYAPPGWPRPRAEGPDGELLPVPWVVEASHGEGVAWTVLHDDSQRAHTERLCQVCGLKLHQVVLLGTFDGYVNGPGCHPRCLALALQFCPHFTGGHDTDQVGWRYEGDGLGYIAPGAFGDVYAISNPVDPAGVAITRAEVKDLARRDPLGQHPAA